MIVIKELIGGWVQSNGWMGLTFTTRRRIQTIGSMVQWFNGYHEVYVESHHVELVLHALFLVVVTQEEGGGGETHAGARLHTLPQTGIEVFMSRSLTEIIQQTNGPKNGTRQTSC